MGAIQLHTEGPIFLDPEIRGAIQTLYLDRLQQRHEGLWAQRRVRGRN